MRLSLIGLEIVLTQTSCSIWFNCRTQSNSIDVLSLIKFNCFQFLNVRFPTPGVRESFESSRKSTEAEKGGTTSIKRFACAEDGGVCWLVGDISIFFIGTIRILVATR